MRIPDTEWEWVDLHEPARDWVAQKGQAHTYPEFFSVEEHEINARAKEWVAEIDYLYENTQGGWAEGYHASAADILGHEYDDSMCRIGMDHALSFFNIDIFRKEPVICESCTKPLDNLHKRLYGDVDPEEYSVECFAYSFDGDRYVTCFGCAYAAHEDWMGGEWVNMSSLIRNV